jgi:hypothetical protein
MNAFVASIVSVVSVAVPAVRGLFEAAPGQSIVA